MSEPLRPPSFARQIPRNSKKSGGTPREQSAWLARGLFSVYADCKPLSLVEEIDKGLKAPSLALLV
jgi:hypothetical protein